MSILVHRDTRVLIQGITGREGSYHAMQMIEYGTNVVAGVVPGRGGEWTHGKPVFDTVRLAIEATEAEASLIMVPPAFAADAIFEALDSGVQLIVCITEGIPIRDMMRVKPVVQRHNARLIGPNGFGILSPGRVKMGTMPHRIAMPGSVGIISKSGALSYEIIDAMTALGIGQSTIVGIGADPILGTDFLDVLTMFENDPETNSVVMVGEIGGREEIAAADYIARRMTKPVVAFIAGRSAPVGTTMGHAGAFIADELDTAESKMDALRNAGALVADNLDDVPLMLQQIMPSA